ncbi:hypothetical protein Ancab_035570 [Ancistrocladus abbreviatus]
MLALSLLISTLGWTLDDPTIYEQNQSSVSVVGCLAAAAASSEPYISVGDEDQSPCGRSCTLKDATKHSLSLNATSPCQRSLRQCAALQEVVPAVIIEVDYGNERSSSITLGFEPPSPRKTEEDTSLPSRRVSGSLGGSSKNIIKRIKEVNANDHASKKRRYHKDDKDKGASTATHGGSTQMGK